MIAPTHAHTRYLLEDLRITHVDVSSSLSSASSSFFLLSALLNLGIYAHKVSQEITPSCYSFADNQSGALSI